MPEQRKFQYTSIATLMSRFSLYGVKRVRVISVNDSLTCDPCRHMHGAILPVEAVMPYVESCESETGCRCDFEPINDEVE